MLYIIWNILFFFHLVVKNVYEDFLHLPGENENIKNNHGQGSLLQKLYTFRKTIVCMCASFYKLEVGILMLYLIQGLVIW